MPRKIPSRQDIRIALRNEVERIDRALALSGQLFEVACDAMRTNDGKRIDSRIVTRCWDVMAQRWPEEKGKLSVAKDDASNRYWHLVFYHPTFHHFSVCLGPREADFDEETWGTHTVKKANFEAWHRHMAQNDPNLSLEAFRKQVVNPDQFDHLVYLACQAIDAEHSVYGWLEGICRGTDLWQFVRSFGIR